jgi:cyclophilin family peptidyl-prolyl cis-trans isomerase
MTLIVTVGLAQNETKAPLTVETLNKEKVTGDEKEVLFEIYTSFGTMKGKLYNSTPKHRDNFIKMANNKYFDSLLFHRVMSQFMIQGGDPDSRDAEPGTLLGNGGPEYTIEAEFRDNLFHKKGVLSAARQPDNVNPALSSSGSQFYLVQGTVYTPEMLVTQAQRINQQKKGALMQAYLKDPSNKQDLEAVMYCQQNRLADSLNKIAARIEPLACADYVDFQFSPEQIKAYSTVGGTPHLDGGYTVFGEIYEGLEVIDKVAATPVDRNNRPLTDVLMAIKIIQD